MHHTKDDWVPVWDPLIRLFHWGLAFSFLLAYLTEDDWMQPHTWAGYTILGLLAFRLVWGLIGSRYARFTNFVRGPGGTWAYLQDILRSRPRRYLGHNPAGAAMVVALLITLGLTGVTGMAVYGYEEFAGPLAGWMATQPAWLGGVLEEVHEFLANTTLVLVGLHVGGVLLASLQHRESLVGSMIHGLKRKEMH